MELAVEVKNFNAKFFRVSQSVLILFGEYSVNEFVSWQGFVNLPDFWKISIFGNCLWGKGGLSRIGFFQWHKNQ